MGTLAYFVHGRGRGHASRSIPVVARLRAEGHTVLVAAGDDALDLLGDDVARPLRSIMPGPGAPLALGRRTLADRRWLRDVGATAVITDGDAAGLHAGYTLGLPSVAVGHGLIFAYCRLPAGLSWTARAYEAVNAGSSAWLARRRVGVHFLPIEPLDDRTVVARPDLDPTLIPAAPTGDHLVAYFRDRNGGPVLRAAVDAGLDVICFGPCEDMPPGVRTHPFDREAFLEALSTGRGLIASSGSNALTEAIAVQRPVLAVHRRDDAEQAMNARLVQRAGLGEALDLAGDIEGRVGRFADRLTRDQFARFDLHGAMPPVSSVVAGTVDVMARIDGRPLPRAPLSNRRR